jgi:SAM-dependent methyltransferase
MDYDQTAIAATYDAARGHGPGVMRQWLDLVAGHAPAGTRLVVDLGCGTGRFSQPLADRLAARVVAVDPSEKMLAVARAKPGDGRVAYRHASAERLRLPDAVADLVFMSMVLHHLPDVPAAARECRRVLRSGGRLVIRTGTRDVSYPQARFFPTMQPLLDAELPSRADVVRAFESAGLVLCAHRLVTQVLALDWPAFADKMALRADSFLARLPDAEFEAGMVGLRAHAAAAAPEPITEEVDFFVFEKEGRAH